MYNDSHMHSYYQYLLHKAAVEVINTGITTNCY